MRNILGNAAKYTPIGTQSWSGRGRTATMSAIRVIDSGPGIDEAAATRRSSSSIAIRSRARAVAGSGIGLFVCASLVEAMGGPIWATQRPEGGAEFGFTLRGLPDDEAGVPKHPVGVATA